MKVNSKTLVLMRKAYKNMRNILAGIGENNTGVFLNGNNRISFKFSTSDIGTDNKEEIQEVISHICMSNVSFMISTGLECIQDQFLSAYDDELRANYRDFERKKHNPKVYKLIEHLEDENILKQFDDIFMNTALEPIMNATGMSAVYIMKQIRNCILHSHYDVVNGLTIRFNDGSFNFEFEVKDIHNISEKLYGYARRFEVENGCTKEKIPLGIDEYLEIKREYNPLSNPSNVVTDSEQNNIISRICEIINKKQLEFAMPTPKNIVIYDKKLTSHLARKVDCKEIIPLTEEQKQKRDREIARKKFYPNASAELKTYIKDRASFNSVSNYEFFDFGTYLRMMQAINCGFPEVYVNALVYGVEPLESSDLRQIQENSYTQNSLLNFFMDDYYNGAMISILEAFFYVDYLKESQEIPNYFCNIPGNLFSVFSHPEDNNSSRPPLLKMQSENEMIQSEISMLDNIITSIDVTDTESAEYLNRIISRKNSLQQVTASSDKNICNYEHLFTHIRNSIAHGNYEIDTTSAVQNGDPSLTIIKFRDFNERGNLTFDGSVKLGDFNDMLNVMSNNAINFYKNLEPSSNDYDNSQISSMLNSEAQSEVASTHAMPSVRR